MCYTCIHVPFCSTHSPISVDLAFLTHKEYAYKRVIRYYEDCNYKKLAQDLAKVDWNNCVFQSDNINEMYSNFTNILQTPIRITTPASRFLHATFLARYATLLTRYATFLARYDTLLARYDTFLARYVMLLTRFLHACKHASNTFWYQLKIAWK
jgi:hypothetical protein